MPEYKEQFLFKKKLLCWIYGKKSSTKCQMLLNLRQLVTSHPALLNENSSLVPKNHRQNMCSSCGHVNELPPCLVAYSQFCTCLPPAICCKLPPEPKMASCSGRGGEQGSSPALSGSARLQAGSQVTTDPVFPKPMIWPSQPSLPQSSQSQATPSVQFFDQLLDSQSNGNIPIATAQFFPL